MYCAANYYYFLLESYCAGPSELNWDTEPRFDIQLGYINPLCFEENHKIALIDISVGINILISLFKVINMIIQKHLGHR